ncbi:helix-turn-helix domain-containing protein [Pseudonocardia humida]|uniref:Helix-turn-helix domain-containing protein n=1 Tax=Pseudonocardia humida TaxID=2800819 RepID=A0ABT1A043_9PSEU|nr:helix-turn-helix domain-containing protein [Pseudonocardia humida]MCO1656372.1 helix-turn-helix domain-containing protein [Pseudonocardia humida]
MLVLDTTSVPPADRAEAFQTTVSANCSTSAATFADPADVRAEVHAFELGSTKVLTIDASGTTLRRTPRMARAMDRQEIALALPLRAGNHMLWEREDRVFGPRDMILVDLAAPYVYRWPAGGASYAFHVDVDELGLPVDAVRSAARELRASPLYPLVRDHVTRVTTGAGTLRVSTAAADVGAATVKLMRALVLSAAGDSRRLGEAMHASTAARVQAYVRAHLRDPDLTPARIAAANGISVRTLYKVYEALGTSLEGSVIEQRLDGAKADLVAPVRGHHSIAAIARSWGFRDASYFARRFGRAFGVSPRQWRATGTGAAAPGAASRRRSRSAAPPELTPDRRAQPGGRMA